MKKIMTIILVLGITLSFGIWFEAKTSAAKMPRITVIIENESTMDIPGSDYSVRQANKLRESRMWTDIGEIRSGSTTEFFVNENGVLDVRFINGNGVICEKPSVRVYDGSKIIITDDFLNGCEGFR